MFLIGVPHRRPTALSPRHIWNRGIAATVSRGKLLLNGPPESMIAALTFDDGPHAAHTPAILKVLNYFGVRATFFLNGEKVKRFPDIVARIADAGHVLGHGGYYQQARASKSDQEMVEELLMTEHWIGKVTGEAPRLYRPAWGKPTMSQMRSLWRRQQTIVLWNYDARDDECASAKQLCLTFARTPIGRGDIVRFHATAPHTAAALSKLIPGARSRGVEFGTPLQWLKQSRGNPPDIRAGC